MCQNISAFHKSSVKESLNNPPLSKKSGIVSLRLRIPGYKQDSLSVDDNRLLIHLSSIRKASVCPYCGHKSTHVHSYYTRRIQGPESFNRSTILLVRVRRFRCRHCARTFSESLPEIAPRYGRKTQEVLDRIRLVSLKTTSRIASSLLSLQHIQSSPSTCLRSIDRTPPVSHATAIGIDDAAQKKRHIYMSLVVDQHSRQLIALLDDRSGKAVDDYFLMNQQVQLVTRDGSVTYADAIRRCLPHAIQISDKFHLIKRMLDTLTEEFSKLRTTPQGEKKTYSFPTLSECKAEMLEALWNLGDERHREKLRFFIEADNAHKEGKSFYQIAQAYNIHTEKVRRILYKHTRKNYMSEEQKLLLKYIDALAMEFSQGCCNVSQLVKKLGNKLSASAIKRVSQTLRERISRQQREIKNENKKMAKKKKENRIPQKTIRRFILSEKSKPEELEKLECCKGVKQAIELAREFREILNGYVLTPLEDWLIRAKQADSDAIKSFARYIKSDQPAVQAAIDYDWNNAVLEGTVNKLKTIKRQMYNKAGLPLLLAKMNGFST